MYFSARLVEAVVGRFRSVAVKINANGERAWLREFRNTPYREGVVAVTFDRNASVYCTGLASNAYDSQKFTSDGTNVWNARYAPLSGTTNRGNAIAADWDGNAYVTGQSPSTGTSNDYATIKYSTNGQQLWVKRFTEAGNSDDQAHAIAVNANGDVYVTGFSNPSPGTYEITTIKYVDLAPIQKKSNGNILLSFFGTPGSNYVIEACAGLTNWVAIGTSTCSPSGLYTFEDTNAPTFGQRFYRTKQE